MFPIAACHSWPNSKGRGGGGASPAGRLQLWRGPKANSGKEFGQGIKGKGQELLEDRLARRPRWGGGALRAFRQAEIIFEAVLFESCVGEAAGSLAVASIFFFAGWYLWVSF